MRDIFFVFEHASVILQSKEAVSLENYSDNVHWPGKISEDRSALCKVVDEFLRDCSILFVVYSIVLVTQKVYGLIISLSNQNEHKTSNENDQESNKVNSHEECVKLIAEIYVAFLSMVLTEHPS